MSAMGKGNNTISLDVLIRFTLIIVLAFSCFTIVGPFIVPLIWGVIIAVALQPLHITLAERLGEKHTLSATIITLVLVAAILLPTILFSVEVVSGIQQGIATIGSGEFQVPDLPSQVKEWPIVGEKIALFWQRAQTNLPGILMEYQEQIKAIASKAGGSAGSLIIGVLQFVFSIIITALLWVNGSTLVSGTSQLATRVLGPAGPEYLLIAKQTIQSVAKGVIGVALIQSLLAALGLAVAGVPAVGLWSALVLILAVAQLPPILVLGPIAAWLFGQESTTVATLFLIWSIVVSASDGVLKPMFLGKGVKVPMVIILMGAIGGMMAVGILGLFVGAVVLGVAYEITVRWVVSDEPVADRENASSE